MAELQWRLDRFIQPQKAQEFVPGLGAPLEASKDGAGDGRGRSLFDAAHDHAKVLRLHYDGDTLGLENVHDGVGNFLGEALLDLKAAGVYLSDTGELGEAQDTGSGNVANVHLACVSSMPGLLRITNREDKGSNEWELTLPVKGTR